MKTTNCFYNDLKNLMNVHNLKGISVVANLTNDNKLIFSEAKLIHFPDDEPMDSGSCHKPSYDELADLLRMEEN